MIRVAHHTSWFTALILTGWLKLLQLFQFMPWHPTTFLKTITDVVFFRYLILFFLLYAVACVLFLLVVYVPLLTPFIGGLIVGLLVSYGFISLFEGEWVRERSVLARNIPFIVTVLTVVRFIFEAASFHRGASRGQKKLPYKTSMLK